MSALHVYFLLRQQQAFKRLLDAPSRSQSSSQAGLSSSGGKSSSRLSHLSSATPPTIDVNARDPLGRSVLHLAASAQDPSATEYVRMLLAHPKINVNLVDKESHWTALHRALYHGNLAAAILLLECPDIDVTLKDLEGYTAYDLYNSTVEGTKPVLSDGKLTAELFTWGANRNATLGVGDGDDRAFPEQISIESARDYGEDARLEERFTQIHVQQISMSKLHTVVVTDESRSNIRACGFGSGGRLGPVQHTQYTLSPIPHVSHTIVSVALGQDHTLALTNLGEVLSWGLNRFAQLGYVVETVGAPITRLEEPVQSTPRKVSGLRGKFVRGVAACKTASVCWTEKEVYSWGTNNGQLGYDKTMQPVQILPRLVSKITQSVLSVTLTDTAMACLLETNDVVCFYNDNSFRVTFPAHAFPSEINAYRPPHANRNVIEKITSCDPTFAALSSNGELFTFNLPPSSDSLTTIQGKTREFVKPQRVWALRKKFTAVKDVALGSDGSIIICTESGHVFVRARTAGKTLKFQRVPYLQRVVKVAANSAGAYGALRIDAVPAPLIVAGNTLAADLALMQPYRADSMSVSAVTTGNQEGQDIDLVDDGHSVDLDEEEDKLVTQDRDELLRLLGVLYRHWQSTEAHASSIGSLLGKDPRNEHGADLIIRVQSGIHLEVPAHRMILALRSPALADVIAGRNVVDHAGIRISRVEQTISGAGSLAPWKDPVHIIFAGCQPITVLILLTYLYSDKLLAIWDWRVAKALQAPLSDLTIKPQQVKGELQRCAQILQLPALLSALDGAFKRDVRSTLSQQFSEFFVTRLVPLVHTHYHGGRVVDIDVVISLEDREVPCHSVVLRARSPVFKAFFDDDDWTRQRWEADGTIRLQYKHLRWRSMQYVMRYLYGGDVEMFDVLSLVHTVEELLDFMFDVMSAANELLLERLVQICSSVILRTVNVWTVCAVLSEAGFYHAEPLVTILRNYVAQNLETLLEGKMLDGLPYDQVKLLAAHIRKEQHKKSPVTRSNVLVDIAMERNRDRLALQNIPQVIAPSSKPSDPRESARLSPPLSTVRQVGTPQPSLPLASRPKSSRHSPTLYSQALTQLHRNSTASDEDVFIMDPIESAPPCRIMDDRKTKPEVSESASKAIGWRALPVPRADMKAIIAEAETRQAPSRKVSQPAVASAPVLTPEQPQRRTHSAYTKGGLSDASRSPGGSPWKPVPNSASVRSDRNSEETAPTTRASNGSQASSKGSPMVVGPPRSQPPTSRITGMGPTFTPSRLSSRSSTSSPNIRRTSSTASAWALPPVQPIAQSSASSTISLTAIQQSEMERLAPQKDKRSLKEIQEEERARQVEEDFLRWWAAEEERLRRQEETATTVAVPMKSPKPSRNTKKQKTKSEEGQKGERRTGSRLNRIDRGDMQDKRAEEKERVNIAEAYARTADAPGGEDKAGTAQTPRRGPRSRLQTEQTPNVINPP